jgi:hypothetical protein
MNELKISGVLREVREHDADGKPFITALLEFRPHQTILLVGVDGGRRELEPFDANDGVRVSGRVAVFKNSLCYSIVLVSGPYRGLTGRVRARSKDGKKFVCNLNIGKGICSNGHLLPGELRRAKPFSQTGSKQDIRP